MRQDYFYAAMVRQGTATKKEVQKLLRHVDRSLYEEHKKQGCWFLDNGRQCYRSKEGIPTFDCGALSQPKYKFSKQYLEKWNTILSEIMGTQLRAYTLDEMAKIGSAFAKFSRLWDLWQPPEHKEDREVWRFKNRKHFPSINYAIRTAHRIANIKGMDSCFPIPTTKSSTNKLQLFWEHIFDELGLQVEAPFRSYVPNKKRYTQLTLPALLSKGIAVPEQQTWQSNQT